MIGNYMAKFWNILNVSFTVREQTKCINVGMQTYLRLKPSTLIDAKSVAFQLESSNQTTRPLGQHAAVVVVVEDTSCPAMRWLGLVRCSPCLSYNFSPSTSLVSLKLVVFFFHVLPNFGYKHKWIWGGFWHSETSWVTIQTHLRMNAKRLVFDGQMHLVPSRPQLILPRIPKRTLEDPRSAVIILKLTVLIPSWLPKLFQLGYGTLSVYFVLSYQHHMARMVIPFDSWNIFRNLWLPTTEQAAVAGHNTRVVGGLLPDTKPSGVGCTGCSQHLRPL